MSKNKTTDSANTAGNATLFSEILFNIPRHNLITEAAFQLLNENAGKKVEEMLNSVGMNAGNWGGWADQIKDSNPPNDPETKKFLQNPKNKNHKPWHFVNLPLNASGYQGAAADGFTREDDVVQMYKKCVQVLNGNSTRFSRVNALRLVGHLVGDIHQPLHIGCSFIDDSTTPPTMVFDQQTIVGKNLKDKSDTGGNKILLPASGNMHSFWDGSLSGSTSNINLLTTDSKKKTLVKTIVGRAKKISEKSKATIGLAAVTPLEDLAREWADESLKIANKAYKNIRMIAKNGKNYDVAFKTNKDDYIKLFRPVIIKQMSLAAHRLADLLNKIYP